MLNINNRRYTGSKYKLMPYIKEIIKSNCPNCHSLFDVFGGTGIVTAELADTYEKIDINDFLFSNEIIYNAFFNQKRYNIKLLKSIANSYNNINKEILNDNYVSINYGDKYFCKSDAKLIGHIRDNINTKLNEKIISKHEYNILLASLLYSFDRCANTVGHYDAFIKNKEIRSKFVFELINPIKTNAKIKIHRSDANILAPAISADITFIDPPYNSRQYSRFYHVMENITKWNKVKLYGSAMKPFPENMSDYCRNNAPDVFSDLIKNLRTKFIVVTYNNTYDSKSSSSRNKISLSQIKEILETRGTTIVFEINYQRFNAGKTDKTSHKEIIFISKIKE